MIAQWDSWWSVARAVVERRRRERNLRCIVVVGWWSTGERTMIDGEAGRCHPRRKKSVKVPR